jgi:hypothetical protein
MANDTGTTLNSLADPSQNLGTQLANDVVLDAHGALETTGHQTGLNQTLHGLTTFGVLPAVDQVAPSLDLTQDDTSGQSLVDIGTDGSALVQVQDDDPSSLASLNDHSII